MAKEELQVIISNNGNAHKRIKEEIIEELAKDNAPQNATKVRAHVYYGFGKFEYADFQYFNANGLALNRGEEIRFTKNRLEARFGPENLYA